MRNRVISFHASDLDRAKLRTVLAAHLAYEHARAFRMLAVRRLLFLAVLTAAIAWWTSWLSFSGALTVAAILGVTAVAIVMAELRARARFRREIAAVPRDEQFL